MLSITAIGKSLFQDLLNSHLSLYLHDNLTLLEFRIEDLYVRYSWNSQKLSISLINSSDAAITYGSVTVPPNSTIVLQKFAPPLTQDKAMCKEWRFRKLPERR
jgi:hypothetical protein